MNRITAGQRNAAFRELSRPGTEMYLGLTHATLDNIENNGANREAYLAACESAGIIPYSIVEWKEYPGFVPRLSCCPLPFEGSSASKNAYANGVIKGRKASRHMINTTAATTLGALKQFVENVLAEGYVVDAFHARGKHDLTVDDRLIRAFPGSDLTHEDLAMFREKHGLETLENFVVGPSLTQ